MHDSMYIVGVWNEGEMVVVTYGLEKQENIVKMPHPSRSMYMCLFETLVAWFLANDFICFPQEQAVAIKTLRKSIHDKHRPVPRRFGEVAEVRHLLQVLV